MRTWRVFDADDRSHGLGRRAAADGRPSITTASTSPSSTGRMSSYRRSSEPASSVASGHRLITTGVAWTDRASAAQLRSALRARGVADVVLVSELHAAGALAQAVGRKVGYERTALMFLEGDTAALSVVDTATGAVVGVQTRRLQPADVMADLREMIVSLERLADQPDGVFVVGSGIDVAEAKTHISTVTTLPVHAPDDADLALARGAALAAAQAPRYEATTVGLAPARDTDDTGALATQLADAGYMAPLGYSQVDDDLDEGSAKTSSTVLMTNPTSSIPPPRTRTGSRSCWWGVH